eukprot:Amastigsp_a2813_7.p4 type:complete len:149 gc:universal Amastigsp_a2813_7:412-858(+)
MQQRASPIRVPFAQAQAHAPWIRLVSGSAPATRATQALCAPPRSRATLPRQLSPRCFPTRPSTTTIPTATKTLSSIVLSLPRFTSLSRLGTTSTSWRRPMPTGPTHRSPFVSPPTSRLRRPCCTRGCRTAGSLSKAAGQECTTRGVSK